MRKFIVLLFLVGVSTFCQAQQLEPFLDGSEWDFERLYGYKDKSGKVVIKPAYSYAGYFQEGFAVVKESGNLFNPYVFIDSTGKVIKTEKPRYAVQPNKSQFSEGLAVVIAIGGSYLGYIDTTGKLVIPIGYEAAADFSGGKALVKKDGKEFYIDKTGKVLTN